MNPFFLIIPAGLFLLLNRRAGSGSSAGGGGGDTIPANYPGSGFMPKNVCSPAKVSPSPQKRGTISPFIDSLPEKDFAARDKAFVVEAKRREDLGLWTAADIQWGSVWTSHGTLAAKVPVMLDALKIDGVRINPSFRASEEIAAILGVYHLTPRVNDAINQQSTEKIPPMSGLCWNETGYGTTANAMVHHSRRVDKAREGGAGGLLNNAGKIWSLTARNWEKPNYGANYGWYIPPYDGRVIQGNYLAHTIDHVDYSQTARYMGPEIEITDGETGQTWIVPTPEVITSPQLAPLLTGHEGALPDARHPAFVGTIA